MKINKGYIAVGLIIAFALFFELGAHADESDQATTITFSQPIQIPGQVLPAGTYLFKRADGNIDQNVVQVFNARQNCPVCQPCRRLQPTVRSQQEIPWSHWPNKEPGNRMSC